MCLIDAADGESVGFLAHPARLFGSTQVTWVYELQPGVSWAAVTPSVIRYLHTIGEAYGCVPPFTHEAAQSFEDLAR